MLLVFTMLLVPCGYRGFLAFSGTHTALILSLLEVCLLSSAVIHCSSYQRNDPTTTKGNYCADWVAKRADQQPFSFSVFASAFHVQISFRCASATCQWLNGASRKGSFWMVSMDEQLFHALFLSSGSVTICRRTLWHPRYCRCHSMRLICSCNLSRSFWNALCAKLLVLLFSQGLRKGVHPLSFLIFTK